MQGNTQIHVGLFIPALWQVEHWNACIFWLTVRACSVKLLSTGQLNYQAVFMSYHSFREEDGQEQENLVNRNPAENNGRPANGCVCACLSLLLC